MRDQPQAWSDRQEPANEGVPAQRPPAEEQPAGTGPDGAWAPPAERVAAGLPGAWMPAGAPAEAVAAGQQYREPDEGRAVDEGREPDEYRDDAEDRAAVDEERDDEERAADNGDRAVGVASVPDDGAVHEEDARDEAARDDDAADDESARDDEVRDGEVRDGEVRDDEVRDDAELHDAAHKVWDEPRLVDNGDDDGGALYRSAADTARDTTEAGAAEDATVGAGAAEDATAEADEAEAEARTDEPPAGGVPDDAVSSQDAPVPAAAYDATDVADADVADVADVADAADTDADVADSAAAGTEAGDATGTELMPGDVPEEPVSALFEAGTASDFRDRWQRVQMRFVDDPRAAAEQARALVDDVVSALQEALSDQRGSLDSWQSGQAGDTEELRVAVRRYRDFLDRMLGL